MYVYVIGVAQFCESGNEAFENVARQCAHVPVKILEFCILVLIL